MATRIGRVRVRGYAWGGDRRPATIARPIGILAPVLVIALLAAGTVIARSASTGTVAGGAPAGSPAERLGGTPA